MKYKSSKMDHLVNSNLWKYFCLMKGMFINSKPIKFVKISWKKWNFLCLKTDKQVHYWEFVFSHSVLSQFPGRFGRARLCRNVLDCSRQKHKHWGIEHIFQRQTLAKIAIKNIVYFIFTSKYTYEWIESTLLI